MSTILPSVPQPQTDQLLGILQSLQGSFPTQLAAAIADWDTPLRAATGEKIIDVHLTAADLAVLHTTAQAVVAAPGATSGIENVQTTVVVQHNGAVMAPNSSMIYLRYGNSAGETASPLFLVNTEKVYRISGEIIEYDSDAVALADWLNKGLVLFADANLGIGGSIATSSLAGGGSGWAANNTFNVVSTDTAGVSATGIVDTVNAGAIVTYHLLTDGDAEYTVGAHSLAATSGVGIGASINADTLDYSTNPVTVDVRVRYGTLAV